MNFSFKTAFILSSVAIVSVSHAAALQLNFNSIVTGDTPSGAKPWATLVVSDFGKDTVQFSLTNNMSSASGQFIRELWLNVSAFPAGSKTTGAFSPEVKTAAFESKNDGVTNAGRKFDFTVGFQNSGSKRLTGGKTATWTASAIGLTASSFNALSGVTGGNSAVYAMAHIQGLPNGGSSKVTGSYQAVPEPTSMAVMAMGAAAVIRRRKKA